VCRAGLFTRAHPLAAAARLDARSSNRSARDAMTRPERNVDITRVLTRGESGTAAGMPGHEARQPLEEAPERGGVLVADRPADLLDRLIAGLKQALRPLDPDLLDLCDRRVAGGQLEASFEILGARPDHRTISSTGAATAKFSAIPRWKALLDAAADHLLGHG
jgi:hypothetical protein